MNFTYMDINNALEMITGSSSPVEREVRRKQLAAYLNHLALNDFSALVQVLYRVDVSEQKIKKVLQDNKEAVAGDLLAELLIERQIQKQAMRSASPPSEDIPDEERW